MTEWTTEIEQALLAPLPPEEVDLRKGANGKFPYIDARAAARRLTAVVGQAGWTWEYDVVRCDDVAAIVRGRLTVLGVTRCDAGEARYDERSPASQETLKAAVSDALKRCAVLFGVGALLYELGPQDAEATRLSAAAINAAARRAGWRGQGMPAPSATPQPGDAHPDPDPVGAHGAANEALAQAFAHAGCAFDAGAKRAWASQALGIVVDQIAKLDTHQRMRVAQFVRDHHRPGEGGQAG